MAKIKNNSLIVTKLIIAGFFAYICGQYIYEKEITYMISPIVGLLGVKSFEFAVSLVSNT